QRHRPALPEAYAIRIAEACGEKCTMGPDCWTSVLLGHEKRDSPKSSRQSGRPRRILGPCWTTKRPDGSLNGLHGKALDELLQLLLGQAVAPSVKPHDCD